MRRRPRRTAPLALTLGLFLLGGCGSASISPEETPITAPSHPTAGSPDAPISDHEPRPSDGTDLLADTRGDAPFYLDQAGVQVAESYPVQLFLEVSGNAPTPCHQVAYTIDSQPGEIQVDITTVAGEGMCAQMLQPHTFVIPLGTADLPVTVRVGRDDFVETVRP